MFECLEQEDGMTESDQRNWKVELSELLELNHRLLDDLISGGILEYENQVDDLEAQSSFLVQRGCLLDLVVKPSPPGRPIYWPVPEFLEALRTTGQEHVANFITRNGCKFIALFYGCNWREKQINKGNECDHRHPLNVIY